MIGELPDFAGNVLPDRESGAAQFPVRLASSAWLGSVVHIAPATRNFEETGSTLNDSSLRSGVDSDDDGPLPSAFETGGGLAGGLEATSEIRRASLGADGPLRQAGRALPGDGIEAPADEPATDPGGTPATGPLPHANLAPEGNAGGLFFCGALPLLAFYRDPRRKLRAVRRMAA